MNRSEYLNKIKEFLKKRFLSTSLFSTLIYLTSFFTLILYTLYLPVTLKSELIYKITDGIVILCILLSTFLFYKQKLNLLWSANIIGFTVITNLFLDCFYDNMFYPDIIDQSFIYAILSSLVFITVIAICSNIKSLIICIIYVLVLFFSFINETQSNINKIPLISIIIIYLTYSGILKFFFSSYQKEYLRKVRLNKLYSQNTDNKLELLKLELNNLSLLINHKQSDISKLKHQNKRLLDELELMRTKETDRKKKNEIVSIVNQFKIVDRNALWADFEIRFKHIEKDFYKKLHTNYPQLSPAEQKLSAFLKLGLSTKQISLLTSTTIASVEVSRSRLRKKLGLSSKDNLKTFFLDF